MRLLTAFLKNIQGIKERWYKEIFLPKCQNLLQGEKKQRDVTRRLEYEYSTVSYTIQCFHRNTP